MDLCINCGTKLDEGAKFCAACEERENKRTFPTEPLSEDDYPQDVRIVSMQAFEQGDEKISLNYIKEEGQDDFRPLNAQIEKK
jgi:hypothetical protein